MTEENPGAWEEYAAQFISKTTSITQLLTDFKTFVDQFDATGRLDNFLVTDLLKMYQLLKEFDSSVEKLRKDINQQRLLLERVIIPTRMEREDVSKVEVPSIGMTFYKSTKYSCKVLDKEGLYDWLGQLPGGEDIITKTVNAQTLTSFVRKRLEEEGVEPPEEVAELKSYESINARKS